MYRQLFQICDMCNYRGVFSVGYSLVYQVIQLFAAMVNIGRFR